MRGWIMKRAVTAIAAVVVIILLVVALVLGYAAFGKENDSVTPLIVSIIGIATTAIPALLAIAKVEDVQHDIRNGVVKNKVKDAMNELNAENNENGAQ